MLYNTDLSSQIPVLVYGGSIIVVSEKEALHYIYQLEQQYEWDQIKENVFKERLIYFLNILSDYNESRASEERSRINWKYGSHL